MDERDEDDIDDFHLTAEKISSDIVSHDSVASVSYDNQRENSNFQQGNYINIEKIVHR